MTPILPLQLLNTVFPFQMIAIYLRLKALTALHSINVLQCFQSGEAWQLPTIKIIITYYGVSGHGKGLVDAMSRFGVKSPLRNAITATDINEHLRRCKDASSNRKYFEIDAKKLNQRRSTESEKLEITGCSKQHIIAYHPDGSIQIKDNICACNHCLLGDLVNCAIEEGRLVGETKEQRKTRREKEEGKGSDERRSKCGEETNDVNVDFDGDDDNEEFDELLMREDYIIDSIDEGYYVALIQMQLRCFIYVKFYHLMLQKLTFLMALNIKLLKGNVT